MFRGKILNTAFIFSTMGNLTTYIAAHSEYTSVIYCDDWDMYYII
jgi:hypothetical protein